MRRLPFCLFIALFPATALAIVSLEDLHLHAPPEGWSGRTGLSLSGNAGNTQTVDLNAGLRINHRAGIHTRFLVTSLDYGQTRGKRSKDRSFIHLRRIDQYRPRLALEAFLQSERDAFARLRLRALAGGGIRLTLHRGERHTSLFGLGGFYSRERLTDSGSGESLDYGQWRANLYLIVKRQVGPGAKLWLTSYAQPDLSEPSDVRLLTSAGVSTPLSPAWRFDWSLRHSYDSRPPLGVRRFDLTYRAGLAFTF